MPVCHDDGLVAGAGQNLIVRADDEGLAIAFEIALRLIDVCRSHRRSDVFEAETGGSERRRIDADPNGRTLSSADADQTDSGQLRNLLRQGGVGQIFDLRKRKFRGCQRERDDWRIGGIHLAVDRRVRHVARQERAAGVDGGLHLLFGDVDVQIQSKLQRDDGAAERTGGRHLLQAGHLSELPFERRRYRRRHDVGTRAGIKRDDLNRRIVDFGQRRHRQLLIGHKSGEQNPDHQQRCRDRPPDEGLGDIH